MLVGPSATTREDKWVMINTMGEKLQQRFDQEIVAIGVYGSVARGTDGPFSDIEMWAVVEDGRKISGYEFIWGAFKVEIDVVERTEFYAMAKTIDDGWAIKAGAFIDLIPWYDPTHVFDEVRELALVISDDRVRAVMRDFMIWEPYETMGKLRNSMKSGRGDYVSLGAKDIAWQTAKLIGLANRQYYTTRTYTFEESLQMASKPKGYEELIRVVLDGTLDDKPHVYQLCENLWNGLNAWFHEMGIAYMVDALPF